MKIETRVAAGRGPLQALKGPSLWNQFAWFSWRIAGAGSVLAGVVGPVGVLLRTGHLHFPIILRGLSLLAFGTWLLWTTRGGKSPFRPD